MKKSELVQLIESIVKKQLNEGNFKAEDIVPVEVKEWYVNGSAKYSGDYESNHTSYKLLIPYEEGDTKKDIEKMLNNYNVGTYQAALQPGDSFNHGNLDITAVKKGAKSYWSVIVSNRGGLDILFENPDRVDIGYVHQSIYDKAGSISFGIDSEGKLYISKKDESHAKLVARIGKNFYWTVDYNGRVFPNIKVISFWTSPSPKDMKQFISDLNEKLIKKHKFKIDINSWKLDCLVPKLNSSKSDYEDVEYLMPLTDYINHSWVYPYIICDFSSKSKTE